MGSVRKLLASKSLTAREAHHSRLFVDVAENVHIHHREYRTVFSVNEFLEYADVIGSATRDLKAFLSDNPDYKEEEFPTTIMISGGKKRQLVKLENSPEPSVSKYFDQEFGIELQDEFVTDEIHIHYRDFRIALDRARFKEVASGFADAARELEKFERSVEIHRASHPDRETALNSDVEYSNEFISGLKYLNLSEISSHWYDDVCKEFVGDEIFLKNLEIALKTRPHEIPPIVVSTELDGTHLIVDGHHRYIAASRIGLNVMGCIVLDQAFGETEHLRAAEVNLKAHDRASILPSDLSGFFQEFVAYKLNRHYQGVYSARVRSNRLWYRIARKVGSLVLGRAYFFKIFNERHNHFN